MRNLLLNFRFSQNKNMKSHLKTNKKQNITKINISYFEMKIIINNIGIPLT
jgi:hypothetical protein